MEHYQREVDLEVCKWRHRVTGLAMLLLLLLLPPTQIKSARVEARTERNNLAHAAGAQRHTQERIHHRIHHHGAQPIRAIDERRAAWRGGRKVLQH